MSPQARRFLEESAPLPPPPTSTDELRKLRLDTRERFRPAAELAKAECVERIEEIELGGIRTWRILPRGWTAASSPLSILYFFGGGFVQGSPFEDLPVTGPIARKTGAEIYVPWYRLSPEHPHPAAHEDALAAYRAMPDVCGEGALAVMGESAGGNLALATLQNARAEGLQLPRSLALLSPWSDLTSAPDSLVANDGHDPTLSASHVSFAADAYRGDRDASDPAISPVFAEYGPEFPPTIITTGTRDLLLSHSVGQSRVMERAGVEVTLRVWEGMWHVFEFYPDLPEADGSLSEVAGHLLRTCAKVTSSPGMSKPSLT